MSEDNDNLNFLDGLKNENPKKAVVELDDKQKLIVLKLLQEDPNNPPSILEMMEKVWPEKKGTKGWDGRHSDGRLIKNYIANELKDLELPTPKTKTEYSKKEIPELTEEQKEFIRNNLNMKPYEQAQVLFDKQGLTATSVESRAVSLYRNELKQQGIIQVDSSNEEVATDNYSPPNTLDRCCARINKYIRDSGLDFKTLSASQKKQCQSLISYLFSYRFNHQINSYSMIEDRELFESVFVSYCYDKPDLTREDVDKMTILATEAVISANKLKNIEKLQRIQNDTLDNYDGEDKVRLSMSLVESINVATQEYDKSVKRQRDLYNDLNEKRSERLKGKLKETASILNVIEFWKQEETRNKMIKAAQQRKEKLKEEINRLETMEDIVGTIFGLDKSEVLNG